jgi:FtsH-binding integral membrane protein
VRASRRFPYDRDTAEHPSHPTSASTRHPLHILAAIGVGFVCVLVFAVAWFWCAGSYTEEFTEESKAQSAGTTMAGWGLAWGLVPVLVLHLVVLICLFFALRDGGRRGVASSLGLALLLVAVTSLPGFLTMQSLSPGGTMFEPPPYVP